MDIDTVLARLRDRTDVRNGGGAADDAIRAAEHILGPFPPSYREFLVEFGWIDSILGAIYGLGSTIPPYLDVVAMTLSERSEVIPALPDHLVALMNDGAGNVLAYDARLAAGGGEPPIVFWNHELDPDQTPSADAPGFAAWLAMRLDALDAYQQTAGT